MSEDHLMPAAPLAMTDRGVRPAAAPVHAVELRP